MSQYQLEERRSERVSRLRQEKEEERAVEEELENTLQAQLQLNELLYQQQHLLDTAQDSAQNTTYHVIDALRENAAAEKERAQQYKTKGAFAGGVGGGVLGVFGGVFAMITVPIASALGGLGGWKVGSLATGVIENAIDKEMKNFDEHTSTKSSQKTKQDRGIYEQEDHMFYDQEAEDEIFVEIGCYENQRYSTISRDWSSKNLSKSERGKWSTEKGDSCFNPEMELDENNLNAEWMGNWKLESDEIEEQDEFDSQYANHSSRRSFGPSPESGWLYAYNFDSSVWEPKPKWNSYVRRRKWQRTLRKDNSSKQQKENRADMTFEQEFGRNFSSSSPFHVFEQKLEEIKGAISDGSVTLYSQGGQINDIEKQTNLQQNSIQTTIRVKKIGSSFLSAIFWGYLVPRKKLGQVQREEETDLQVVDVGGWEFIGQEPTTTERMLLEAQNLKRGAQEIGREIDLQNRGLDRIAEKQEKNSKDIKKIVASIDKEL